MRAPVDLVVIGGSAGAIDVLRTVFRSLEAGFSPAMAVVVHVPADGRALLPEIFATPRGLRMKLAEDKEPIESGTVYFAPPDYHLLVEKTRTFALSLDERVHYSRPAIDVLFESAADAYGDRLLGVILSGANDDGARGLAAVAAAGGATLVQSLDSSDMKPMPAAALQAAPGSLVVNASALADALRAHGEMHGR